MKLTIGEPTLSQELLDSYFLTISTYDGDADGSGVFRVVGFKREREEHLQLLEHLLTTLQKVKEAYPCSAAAKTSSPPKCRSSKPGSTTIAPTRLTILLRLTIQVPLPPISPPQLTISAPYPTLSLLPPPGRRQIPSSRSLRSSPGS